MIKISNRGHQDLDPDAPELLTCGGL